MIQGFDYASIDGQKIDYTKVQASFVIIRGSYGYGKVSLPDSNLARDRGLWSQMGKRVGSYMILSWNAANTPEDQVAVFARSYGARRPGELPPSLDLEADSAASLHMTPAACLAWAERAYDALVKLYGTVMVYTSLRVWAEVFGNLPSKMGASPLWLKVAYPMKVREPHRPDLAPQLFTTPGPWKPVTSPGVWIVQYQGDAVGVPGFSSTIDCNYFRARTAPDSSWLAAKLHINGNAVTIAEWQQIENLASADGIIGPATFCVLTE